MPNAVRWRFVPALMFASTVFANNNPDQLNVLQSADGLEDTPGIEAPPEPGVWDIRIGALGGVHPDYHGSDDYQTSAAPFFRVNYRDRLILSGRAVRARLIDNGPLRFGPIARLRGGRDEDDNADLEGLGDDDNSVELGAFLRYKTGPYRFRMIAVQDIGDGHNGALVEVRSGVQVPFNKPWFLLSGNVTWADEDYTKSYFGITASEAARSGLSPFSVGAGLRDVGVTISSRLPIWRELSVVAAVNYQRLLGDAADSPLTDDVGSANQVSANMGLLYRF